MKTRINLIILSFLFVGQLFSQVGIGTITPEPSSVLDITAIDKGLIIPRVSLNNVTTTQLDGVNTAASGLLIWNTNATTVGGSGIGFYYFDAVLAIWQRLSNQNVTAENGLNLTGTAIRLGGSLLENTTITNGAFDFDINLDALGDFHVQDNGVNHFSVESNGDANFGSDVFWNDGSTTGTRLASLINSGDDGQFRIYENGIISIDLDANGASVFNQQGLDRDFRVESDTRENTLLVDASNNLVRFGSATGAVFGNGTATINGYTVDYVADFDITNGMIGGTAVGIGTQEYLMDMGSAILGVGASLYPVQDNASDLGSASFRWDDVYATNGTIQTSDVRDKTKIQDAPYGLTEILKLRPISYQWKNKKLGEGTKLGFSAQELLTVIPEVVKTHDLIFSEETGEATLKENERLGVYYSDIIPVLTKAIQEQQELILKLEQRINSLENKN